MPMYWGLHHVIHETEINSHYEGRRREYLAVPGRARINPHDIVFLFRGDDYLYGWGVVLDVGRPYAEQSGQEVKNVAVDPRVLRQQLVRVEDIRQSASFRDFDLRGRIGPISALNPEQVETLIGLLPGDRAKPPSPPREIPEGWERMVQTRELFGGQGSITKVRRAIDGAIGALKRLLPENQRIEERRFRLQREVNSLEALDGRGIPRVLESNVSEWKNKDVDLYFIQEWIEGPTLGEYVNRRRLSLDDALGVTQAILETLKICHELYIFHRDLKPDNVILKEGNLTSPIIVDFGMAFTPPPDGEIAEFRTGRGQEIGNRFLRLPEFAKGRRTLSATSDLTYLVGLLFFIITSRTPNQLLDEEGKMPHVALARAIPEEIIQDGRWKTLEGVFDIGFQFLMERRFQSTDKLERFLEMLRRPDSEQRTARLMLAVERLQQVRASDDVQLPKLAAGPIRNSSQKLYDSLRAGARERGFSFDNNGVSMIEVEGLPGSNTMLGIYIEGESGVGATGHHSIMVRGNNFVARYQVEGRVDKEYFEGPVIAPSLLEKAVEDIVPEILTELIELYTARLQQKHKR